MSEALNLIGQKFGCLTVIEKAPNKGRKTAWLCECNCKNHTKTIVTTDNLRSGKVKSCGCVGREKTIKRNKEQIRNKYDLTGSFGKGWTLEGDEFLFDLEDYDKIKNIAWHSHDVKREGKYVSAIHNGKRIYLHRLVMNPPKNLVVDHIEGNTFDNRKEKLRICTKGENALNKKSNKDLLGIVIRGNSIGAQIRARGKNYWLGSFSSIEEAKKARENAELVLLGKFKHIKKEDKEFVVCYNNQYKIIKGENNAIKKGEELKEKNISFFIFDVRDNIFNIIK